MVWMLKRVASQRGKEETEFFLTHKGRNYVVERKGERERLKIEVKLRGNRKCRIGRAQSTD
jgi:hypothetical protein